MNKRGGDHADADCGHSEGVFDIFTFANIYIYIYISALSFCVCSFFLTLSLTTMRFHQQNLRERYHSKTDVFGLLGNSRKSGTIRVRSVR